MRRIAHRTVPAPADARAQARASACAVADRRRAARFVLMLPLLALGGCGGAGHNPEVEVHAQPSPVPAPAPLHLRLEAPDTVRAGRQVPLRLVLENRGETPIEVELVGSPIAFDLQVLTAGGEVVWSRLDGVPIEDILQPRTLAPGQAIVFADHWNQRDGRGRRVAPGPYRLRGVLPVVEVPAGWGTDPRTLTVLP
jgi:hypothetical protein